MTIPENLSHYATILPVSDVRVMTEFYTQKLEFTVEFTWEDPPSYVILSLGEAIQLHLTEAGSDQKSKPRRPFAYVFVHDVDAMHQRLQQNGVRNITPPQNAEYGMRDFEMTDPEHNVMLFATSLEGTRD